MRGLLVLFCVAAPLSAAAKGEEIPAPLTTKISGRIFGPDFQPLAGIPVELRLYRAPFPIQPPDAVLTDKEGRFEFDAVGPAEYTLVARTSRWFAWRAKPFIVSPDGPGRTFSLLAEPAFSASAEIDAEKGALCALKILRQSSPNSYLPLFTRALGLDRKVTLEGLPPGAYLAEIVCSNHDVHYEEFDIFDGDRWYLHWTVPRKKAR